MERGGGPEVERGGDPGAETGEIRGRARRSTDGERGRPGAETGETGGREGRRRKRWRRGRDGLTGARAPEQGATEGRGARPGWGTGRPPADLPSGPWADAGGRSRVPPGPGRRGRRSPGQRPPTGRGADARGWGRRPGARPPHPRRRQWPAPGSAEAARMDPRRPPPAGVRARGS